VRDNEKVSDSTIRRVSAYYRAVSDLLAAGRETASSYEIARMSGTTSPQLRKDLSNFGNFGTRGTGYRIAALHEELKAILGLNRRWRVAVVGAGNLAHALAEYREFRRQGFEIAAVFDVDPARIGQDWDGVVVRHLDEFLAAARAENFEMGVITTPAAAAQEVADRMVEAGIQGILNFASVKLTVPDHVTLRNVDMAIELESLSFALK
jgi:redox-sensing transcriptional repressor